jgi:hypothetical protein
LYRATFTVLKLNVSFCLVILYLDISLYRRNGYHTEGETVKKKLKKKVSGRPRKPPEAPPKSWREALYRFARDLLLILDVAAVVTLVLYALSIYKFVNFQAAIVLATFSLVRGLGHFSALRMCGVRCLAMRFIPILGGFVVCRRFRRRFDEGFSALGASFWVLYSALGAFLLYLLTGSTTCLIFFAVALTVNLFVLLPIIGIDLDGTAVFKSITFSISRRLGLLFVAVNGISTTALLYWFLSRGEDPVNPTYLGGPIIAGIQRFLEEYRRPEFSKEKRLKFSMEPMDANQIKTLFGFYAALLLGFWVAMMSLSSLSISSTILPEIECAGGIGIIGLLLISVLESNIIFFINLKRRIFGKI